MSGYTLNLSRKDITVSSADAIVSDILAIKYEGVFVSIPSGTFRMGDIQNFNWYSQEKPVHYVTISSFDMSVYEVTNLQYKAYLTTALADSDITASSSISNK